MNEVDLITQCDRSLSWSSPGALVPQKRCLDEATSQHAVREGPPPSPTRQR